MTDEERDAQICALVDELTKANHIIDGRGQERDVHLALIRDLIEALRFYMDGFSFHPNRTITGIDLSEWKPKPLLLEDCGNVAKRAINRAKEQGFGHER